MGKRLNDLTTILLVDDDENDCAAIKLLLRMNGYRVIDTDNGLDAVAAACVARPDLLLVNLCTPLLYEIIAARQIIKKARLSELPVLLLAKPDEWDQNFAVEVEIKKNEFVARVADYEYIEQMLEYLLTSRPLAAEAHCDAGGTARFS